MNSKKTEWSEEQLAAVEEMGRVGFFADEIAAVLEMNVADFLLYYQDHDSEIYKRFRKGYLESQLKLRQRIFKDAGHGSSPAQTLAKKILDDCDYKNKQL